MHELVVGEGLPADLEFGHAQKNNHGASQRIRIAFDK
jgi:hypothetical protein